MNAAPSSYPPPATHHTDSNFIPDPATLTMVLSHFSECFTLEEFAQARSWLVSLCGTEAERRHEAVSVQLDRLITRLQQERQQWHYEAGGTEVDHGMLTKKLARLGVLVPTQLEAPDSCLQCCSSLG